MVDYVRLRSTDLELLMETMQRVVDYKFHALSRPNWQIFERDYLPSLVEQLRDNRFKVVTASDNIFEWCLDQIIHSRQIVAGISRSSWIPLADFEDVQQCLAMLRSARVGSESYQRYCQPSQFNSLFDPA
jgi:hypothetical protein